MEFFFFIQISEGRLYNVYTNFKICDLRQINNKQFDFN